MTFHLLADPRTLPATVLTEYCVLVVLSLYPASYTLGLHLHPTMNL